MTWKSELKCYTDGQWLASRQIASIIFTYGKGGH